MRKIKLTMATQQLIHIKMQEENTKTNSDTEIETVAVATEVNSVNTESENTGTDTTIDPIQEAYNLASYDLKKYLSGDEFPRTIELINQANKLQGDQATEVNFICLMLALKIIKYDHKTGEGVMQMLSQVGLDIHNSSQIWSDIETYIIPNIPELGVDDQGELGNVTINRSITLDTQEDNAPITHFGPASIEMRLRSVGAPRITLDQLSHGDSLLHGVNANIDINNTRPRIALVNKTINYNSHPDPYRELVDE